MVVPSLSNYVGISSLQNYYLCIIQPSIFFCPKQSSKFYLLFFQYVLNPPPKKQNKKQKQYKKQK